MENPLKIYNPEIGTQHNEVVLAWIANTSIEKGLSFAEKIDDVKSFLLSEHEVDVSPMYESWFNESGNGIISGAEYLEKYKDTISNYFHEQLSQVYSETEGKSLNHQKDVAMGYLNQIPEDQNLSEDERNIFLNMMTLYVSSADLWSGIETNPPQNNTFGFWDSIPESSYKKIAWSDIISGVMGGLMGGGAGVIVGVVGGSLLSAISESNW